MAEQRGLEQSSPRRAENEDMPLRQIFDDVWRTSSVAGQHLSLPDLEAAMYKRRRRAQPVLTTTSAEADSAVIKVVPTTYYQLFTLLVPFTDLAFPVCIRTDFAEDKSVPESIASCAAVRTVWTVSGRISTCLPRRWCIVGCWLEYVLGIIEIVHLCLIWCHVVRAHHVHHCYLVSRCPVSRSQSPQFWWSRDVSSSVFSRPRSTY